LNLNVGVAASYIQTEWLEGKIRDTNRKDLLDFAGCQPASDLDVLGTIWPFESYTRDVVSRMFRCWCQPQEFPKLSEVFAAFGFTPVGSMSYFSTSFCIGDIRVPVGAAVEVGSCALRYRTKRQQTNEFALQQLIAANLPILVLIAISCCHVDDKSKLVYEPFPEAFVFGVAILDQEVMIELLVPYLDRDSGDWRIYCSPCHSIVLGDLTLARMRPPYKYLQLLDYISTIQIHHQALASKLVGYTWDEDVSAVLSQLSPVN